MKTYEKIVSVLNSNHSSEFDLTFHEVQSEYKEIVLWVKLRSDDFKSANAIVSELLKEFQIIENDFKIWINYAFIENGTIKSVNASNEHIFEPRLFSSIFDIPDERTINEIEKIAYKA